MNISVDPDTYERLQKLKEQHGFKNACELVVAFVHILLDRLELWFDVGIKRYTT